MRYLFLLVVGFSFLVSCNNENTANQSGNKNIDSLFALYPDSVPIIIAHGNKMIQRYDFNAALNDGAKAYRMDSMNIEARLLYAKALNNRAERTTTDVRLAQRHFKFILSKDNKNKVALVELAATYSQQGEYDKAFKLINECLRIDKRYREAYVLKGSIYLTIGNRDLAKSSYETAVQQDPKFFEAYLKLGSLYEEERDSLCIQYYLTAVDLKPSSIDGMYALAYAYQNFDHEDDAAQIYRNMARIQPEYAVSYFQLGWIKQFKKVDLDSALVFYKLALQKEPRYTEAWHNLGLCYKDKGDKTAALQSFGKALKYNPDFYISREEAEKLR